MKIKGYTTTRKYKLFAYDTNNNFVHVFLNARDERWAIDEMRNLYPGYKFHSIRAV